MLGYAGNILRINLTNQTYSVEPTPKELMRGFIGGRGFNMWRLYYETPQQAGPLHEDNNLYIGVGPLNGTSWPGAARVNFSGRSPQTGNLGDSNVGGAFGPEVKYAGYDQIIIQGQAEKPVWLFIHNGKVQFNTAAHLQGLDVVETQATIKKALGTPRVQVAVAGPAAHAGVVFTGIFCSGVRAAGRTGMGRLMASKNVMAVAVLGHKAVRAAHPEKFEAMVRDLIAKIKQHPQYAGRLQMGTTFLMSALNNMGALSSKHFQEGTMDTINQVSGEALSERVKIKNRGCFSCTVPCSRVYKTEYKGHKMVGEGPEFEGLMGFSGRVGASSLEFSLASCNRCNRLGLDVITTAEVISFCMELHQRGMLTSAEADGLDLSWGNEATIATLIEKIARREGFGDILADGVDEAARKLGRGREYCMSVKGLELFMADPRGLKGYAAGLAVASRGGDHLRSEPSFEFSNDYEEGIRRYGAAESANRLAHKGKGRLLKDFEERSALSDSLNVCKNTLVNMEIMLWDETAQLLELLTGEPWSGEEVHQACERIVNVERLYLARLGMGRKDDTLPDRFLKETLTTGDSAGQVVDLDSMLDEYYTARGWDVASGLPTQAKLDELCLRKC